ncbi:MAG TPA: hypothetical protein VNM45_06080 [Bacillus sp. (in: firmicutes)]|nr:hypothetical protein [Bacillus sp. (in: firmicutes)]
MLNYLFELFGIQQTQANLDNFKIAFWSGFLYTLLISILVGLFLMWLERKISTKVSKRLDILHKQEEYFRTEKEFESFKQELSSYFSLPAVIIPSNDAEDWIPSNYIKIILGIRYSPYINIEKAQDNRYFKLVNLLKKCEKITAAHEEFKVVSRDLTYVIANKTSEHNYKISNLSWDETKQLRELGIDETDYISAETILALINEFNEYPSHKKSSPAMRIYEGLKEDKLVNDKIKQYIDKKMELFSCINDLKEELKII